MTHSPPIDYTPPAPAPHLPQVPCGAALHQGHPRSQAQAVDVAPRLQVVQPAQHQGEAAEEVEAKLGVLDIALHAAAGAVAAARAVA